MERVPREQLDCEDDICRFQGRLFTGIAVEEHEGKLISEAQYRTGVRDGLTRVWYENGQLKYEVNYKMNAANGLRREWYPDGSLKAERLIELGILVDEREWDRDGNPFKEYHIDTNSSQYKLLQQWRAGEDERVKKLLANLGASDPQSSLG